MEKEIKPYLTVIALISLTVIVLLIMGDTTVKDSGLSHLTLPELTGRYKYSNILHCQNLSCKYSLSTCDTTSFCPKCGAPLDMKSSIEKAYLPIDTIVRRKLYVDNNTKQSFVVTLVISGEDRTSIHRPQMCLPAQGYKIIKQYTTELKMPDNKLLKISILDTINSRLPIQEGLMAYWFISKTRETPYHLQRIFWTTASAIFKGTSEQWAYISIATGAPLGEENAVADLRVFIAELYPAMTRN